MTSQVRAVLSALAYAEEHLCEPVSVGEMASAAGYSLYHFMRVFNAVVQHTPYDYLLRRRLSHAAQLLLTTEMRVLDVALACQFKSHEGFTRAFGRLFGLSPSGWRQRGFQPPRVLMPRLGRPYLDLLQMLEPEAPFFCHLPEKQLWGWMQLSILQKPVDDGLEESLIESMVRASLDVTVRQLWSLRIFGETVGALVVDFCGFEEVGGVIPRQHYLQYTLAAGDYLGVALPAGRKNREAAAVYLFHTLLPKSGCQPAGAYEVLVRDPSPRLLIPVKRGPAADAEG